MDKVVSAWGIKIPLWNACALIHFSMLCEKYIECFVQQVLNIAENNTERNCSLIFANDKTWALSSQSIIKTFGTPAHKKKLFLSSIKWAKYSTVDAILYWHQCEDDVTVHISTANWYALAISPVAKKGVFYLFERLLPYFMALRRSGGGVSTLWWGGHYSVCIRVQQF
jgi:hypothetical protein